MASLRTESRAHFQQDGVSVFQIQHPGPFSFEHSLSFLRRSPFEILHRSVPGGVRKVWTRGAADAVLFEVRAGAAGHLAVRVLNRRAGAALRRDLTAYIRRWFDLDRDLGPFQKLARKDPVLRDLARAYRGYRIVAIPDLFECLVWAVIGQQINLAFAYRLKRSFVEALGERLEFEGEGYYAFPKTTVVARVRPERLRRMQFSRQKIEYVRIIARAFESGELSQAQLESQPFEEAHRILTRIKGIGNWTANYALMRCLLRPEAFPREDVGIHNALRKQLQLDRKPTLAEVDEVFARYRGHEAYASAYLWKSLNDGGG